MPPQFPFLEPAKASERWKDIIDNLEQGEYRSILQSEASRSLLHHGADFPNANSAVATRESLADKLSHCQQPEVAFALGLATLQLFVQSNVTGPPLEFDTISACFPGVTDDDEHLRKELRQALILDLAVDGDSVYVLTPHVELFWLARCLLRQENVGISQDAASWARLRVHFWHQKLLSEPSSSLQDAMAADLALLEGSVLGDHSPYDGESKASFLIERSAIRTYYDADKKAREDLQEAARLRGFHHVLTGRLGRRTKFQQFDISQLVVLAKSKESTTGEAASPSENGDGEASKPTTDGVQPKEGPKNLDLNDDTLLERISFIKPSSDSSTAATPEQGEDQEQIPPALSALDPANQPLLHPLDSAILLAFASSITNTSPEHGLSREETLPYATRVLEGGSSNWQVYTQALLVRSRIEGYRSRTVERGVLQLQALVDQVIAETTGSVNASDANAEGNGEGGKVSTFLPKATASESAPAVERLRYIHQLSTPPRWALEGELAARWASLGGLRTALEIYERLHMWAEAALCLAATDQESKAICMVRRQLYEAGPPPASHAPSSDPPDEQFYGAEKQPPDAPRLLCILGDLEAEPAHYERAWAVSHRRYARAQRSLGKFFVGVRDLPKADEAYALSLRANPQHAPTWFALGCVRLETQAWAGAVDAFQRAVHIEHDDAEAWSNLAAALANLPPETADGVADEEHDGGATPADGQLHLKQSFAAFKRAAALKRESYRIWQNVLNTGARLAPPPFTDLLIAQRRIIELRGTTEGEGCVDVEILSGIARHVMATAQDAKLQEQHDAAAVGADQPDAGGRRHGLEKMLLDLVLGKVVPLITRSRALWQLVARLELFRGRPGAALDAHEKAWRATVNMAGWDDGSVHGGTTGAGEAWAEVQEATEELVDAYESLGEREVTEGLKAGSGELVCKNWRFKARTAVRGIVARRTKAGFEDVDRLKARLDDLNG